MATGFIVTWIICLAFTIALLVLYWKVLATIANKRGRSTLPWFLLSFLLSPVFVILLLLVMGETDEKRRERIEEEERQFVA